MDAGAWSRDPAGPPHEALLAEPPARTGTPHQPAHVPILEVRWREVSGLTRTCRGASAGLRAEDGGRPCGRQRHGDPSGAGARLYTHPVPRAQKRPAGDKAAGPTLKLSRVTRQHSRNHACGPRLRHGLDTSSRFDILENAGLAPRPRRIWNTSLHPYPGPPPPVKAKEGQTPAF